MEETNNKTTQTSETGMGNNTKKKSLDPSLLKRQNKSNFFIGGKPTSKSFHSDHGFSTQKNHRVKHG